MRQKIPGVVVPWSVSYFIVFICIFVNTLFNGHSIGSGFTKFGSEDDKPSV
jgi:hypothetical protein